MDHYDVKIDYLEQQQLSANIVISGIPLSANESIDTIFTNISSAIKFEKGIDAVDTIYWMKSPKLLHNDIISKRQIPIFVRFISQRYKMLFFKQYITFKNLSLRHIGMEMDTRIYCNNYLTKHNYSILQAAIKIKQTGNVISKVFSKGGLVYVTYLKNNKNLLLRNIDDLHNVAVEQVSLVGLTTNSDVHQITSNDAHAVHIDKATTVFSSINVENNNDGNTVQISSATFESSKPILRCSVRKKK